MFPFNIDEILKFVEYWENRNIDVSVGIGRADERYQLKKDHVKYVTFNRGDYIKMEQVLFQLSNIYPKYLFFLINHYLFPLKGGKKIMNQ
jgi:hypothetical protein